MKHSCFHHFHFLELFKKIDTCFRSSTNCRLRCARTTALFFITHKFCNSLRWVRSSVMRGQKKMVFCQTCWHSLFNVLIHPRWFYNIFCSRILSDEFIATKTSFPILLFFLPGTPFRSLIFLCKIVVVSELPNMGGKIWFAKLGDNE